MDREFKDKDGKIIDLSGVDAKTVDAIGLIVEGQAIQIRQAVTAAVAEQVKTAVGGAVAEAIKPFAEKLDAAPAKKPEGGGDKTDLERAIEAAMKPLMETVNGIKTERDGERKSAASRTLAEQLVAKERPNLKGRDRLVARIAAAGVTTEDEARKVMGEWDAEMKDLMGEDNFKKLCADSTAEGAKEQAKGTEAEKAQAKADLLKDIKGQNAA